MLLRALVVMVAGTAFVGCNVTRAPKSPQLDPQARWIVLPVANHSTTPQAGERMEAILVTLLRTRGVMDVETYVPPKEAEATAVLESDEQRVAVSKQWAKEHGFRYAVAGTVIEWGYKSGIDAEPAVGVSVRVLDVSTSKTLWAAAGSRTGWGRDSVSGVALALTDDLLSALSLTR